MATDSRGPSGTHSLVLLAVLGLAGYAAWKTAPLARRMDALERANLEARDRLQSLAEKLQGADPRPPAGNAPAPSRPRVQSPAPSTGTSSDAAAPPASERLSHIAIENFLARRLFPDDASLAMMMIEGLTPIEIARRKMHSIPFVIAKGIQIEKQLAAAPDTPPDVLAEIRAANERAKPKR